MSIEIAGRKIGENYKPFVIAEIGINHEGDITKAKKMVDAAFEVGCECVKFQTHVVEDEMSHDAKSVIPGNAKESIWDIMDRCTLTEKEETELMNYVESKGMIFISTPFSRAAADQLYRMGVKAFKIGSGECNNYPLIEHIAQMGKPIILSTGMNNMESVAISVDILRKYNIPFALLHCTSIYPTPFDKVRLNSILEIKKAFPDAVVGISDHTTSPYPVLGSIPLGSSIIERHFTADRSWPGPDIEISMDPEELKLIIEASEIIWLSTKGTKEILPEEQVTIDFAYASVVTIKPVKKGEVFSNENLWVKRPGTGELKAIEFNSVIGKMASRNIDNDQQLKWDDISE